MWKTEQTRTKRLGKMEKKATRKLSEKIENEKDGRSNDWRKQHHIQLKIGLFHGNMKCFFFYLFISTPFGKFWNISILFFFFFIQFHFKWIYQLNCRKREQKLETETDQKKQSKWNEIVDSGNHEKYGSQFNAHK